MNAKEFLTLLQRKYNKYYPDFFIDYNKFREEYIKKFGEIYNEEALKRAFNRNVKEENERPTKFQNTLYYNFIKNSIYPLEDLIKKKQVLKFFYKDINLIPIPTYGTIEIEEHYAFTTVTDTEPLIVISEELILLLERMSSLVAANLLYGIYDNSVQENIIRHYIDLIICSIFYKNKDAINLWILENEVDEDFVPLEIELFCTSILFIFCHEYSHLILGHIGKSKSIIINNINVDIKNYSWKQELDADLLGSRLTLSSKPLSDFLGIFLALESLQLSSAHKICDTNTHPALLKRVSCIREYAKICHYEPGSYYMFEMLIEPMAVQLNLFLDYLIKKKIYINEDNLIDIQNIIYNEFPIISQKSIFDD